MNRQLRRFCYEQIYRLLLPACVAASTVMAVIGLLRFYNLTAPPVSEPDLAAPAIRPIVLP